MWGRCQRIHWHWNVLSRCSRPQGVSIILASYFKYDTSMRNLSTAGHTQVASSAHLFKLISSSPPPCNNKAHLPASLSVFRTSKWRTQAVSTTDPRQGVSCTQACTLVHSHPSTLRAHFHTAAPPAHHLRATTHTYRLLGVGPDQGLQLNVQVNTVLGEVAVQVLCTHAGYVRMNHNPCSKPASAPSRPAPKPHPAACFPQTTPLPAAPAPHLSSQLHSLPASA